MTILNVLATSVIGATVSLSGAPADEAYIEIMYEEQTQDIPALMTVQDVYAHYLMEIDYAEDTDKLEEQDEKEPEDDEDKDKDNNEEGESDDETKAPKETDTDEDSSDIRDDVSEESNDDGRNEGRSGDDEGEEESEETAEQESEDETEEADEDDEEVVDESNGESMTMEATYYTALCDTGCTGTTATGVDVSGSNMHEGKQVIAVDPDVIPLNSTVEVSNGGETFTAIAADTGGDVNGNRIDILVGSVDEANEKGRHSVKVEIID